MTRGREGPDRGAGGSGQSRLPTPLLHGLASTSRGHAEPHLPTVPCGGRMFKEGKAGLPWALCPLQHSPLPLHSQTQPSPTDWITTGDTNSNKHKEG